MANRTPQSALTVEMASVEGLRATSRWSRILSFALRSPWSIALLASLALWLTLTVISGQNGVGVIVSNAFVASFVAIAALAQMLVITSGNGAIDLSIPYTISLSVYVVTILQQGQDAQLPLAIVVSLLVGLLVGAVNGFFVVVLRIPAIVSTLAVGFVIDSVVNILSNVPGRGQASNALQGIAKGSILGIPFVMLIAIAIAALVSVFLWRTSPGLQVIATGQNDAAAAVAGLRPGRARFTAFALSGVLSAVTGILLCGYSNGAFLGIGSTYLMASIAAVVLGGTLIAGGMPTVVGCLIGALFLTLVIALTNTVDVPIGIRWLIEGGIIIAALAIRSRKK